MDKKRRVLQLLSDASDWITAKQLAAELNVSDRTIKSYLGSIIQELDQCNITVVASRGKGFCVEETDRGKLLAYLERGSGDDNLLPDILMELLQVDEIGTEELCDLYAVSTSFLKGKLKEIRTFFIQEGNFLSLINHKSSLHVAGEEKKKRQMMQMIVMNRQSALKLQAYAKYFPVEMLMFIKEHLLREMDSYGILISDINVIRITIYLGIMVERVGKGYILQEGEDRRQGKEQELADRLAECLAQKYKLDIPDIEKKSLASYIALNRILGVGTKRAELEEPDTGYLELVERIIGKIKQEFLLNLSKDEELSVGLAYHVKRLDRRKKYDDKYVNPILNDLRDSYPYIYEVAIFFGQCLTRSVGLHLDENEIGCIAIHLAAAIERMKTVQYMEPVNVLVVCHMGYTNMQFLITKLQSMYPGDIIFHPVMSSYHLENIRDERIDMILTTTSLEEIPYQCPVIQINPYLTKRDIARINEALYQNHHMVFGDGNENGYFKEELFFPQLNLKDQREVIKYMTEVLVNNGYVRKTFYESALARENLSSTATQNLIAIPHALENNAYKTAIAVAALDKPIRWGERSAQLIFMLAVRKEDKKYLQDFYEWFVSLTEDIKLVEKLLSAKTFGEFKENIKR